MTPLTDLKFPTTRGDGRDPLRPRRARFRQERLVWQYVDQGGQTLGPRAGRGHHCLHLNHISRI